MRTLVDIPTSQLNALTEISKREKLSRAALIRKAIELLLAQQQLTTQHEAFALLQGKQKINALTYQRKLRSEWSQ